jgi:hypothetical protein
MDGVLYGGLGLGDVKKLTAPKPYPFMGMDSNST